MSIKPEDLMADEQSQVNYNGVIVRKGTAAAILANADILAKPEVTTQEKQAAKEMIAQLMPGMIAANFHKHLQWKNPEIQEIMEAAVQNRGL